MSAERARWPRHAAACLLVISYVCLSHYCNSHEARGLGAALALSPSCAAVSMLLWRGVRPLLAVLLTAALAGVLFSLWPWLMQNFSFVAMLQESSIYALLGLSFASSLMTQRTALCTKMADRLHGPLNATEVRYTRRVTGAWAGFFFAVAALSVLLYLDAPLSVWSIFVNFCVLPLVGVMFLGEYLVRGRLLRHLKRGGLLATVRVYFANPG